MNDLLAKPRAMRVLLELRRHGPGMMRDFLYYAKLSDIPGLALREWMEEAGLIEVETAQRETPTRGHPGLEIRLTKWGERIADKLAETDPMVEAARKAADARKK